MNVYRLPPAWNLIIRKTNFPVYAGTGLYAPDNELHSQMGIIDRLCNDDGILRADMSEFAQNLAYRPDINHPYINESLKYQDLELNQLYDGKVQGLDIDESDSMDDDDGNYVFDLNKEDELPEEFEDSESENAYDEDADSDVDVGEQEEPQDFPFDSEVETSDSDDLHEAYDHYTTSKNDRFLETANTAESDNPDARR